MRIASQLRRVKFLAWAKRTNVSSQQSMGQSIWGFDIYHLLIAWY
ncbi:MAG TPA: hypothetical protein VE863_18200 [Pyrinomonadaceae bacterium]|nr:hypothetical protein [Pyrinomonadaceae bacterium]